MVGRHPKIAFAFVIGAALVWVLPATGRPQRTFGGGQNEVHLTNREFKKLDRFEAHALGKADKAYGGKKFRQASAEYESFLREYPRSLAIPYVLLRKARCLHKDDKRHLAIRQYNEVVDYFPNAVEYAAAALFYQGLGHWENGDEDKAMKPWARMARDKQYRKHRLAAGAVNKLADSLMAKGHADSAVAYFWQIAVDFRNTNKDEAEYARDKVIEHHVRTNPNEPKLRSFTAEARILHGGRKTDEQGLLKDFGYWNTVRTWVQRHGQFKQDAKDLKQRYYDHWARQLDGKFPHRDDYRIGVADFYLASDGDLNRWVQRLDEQFVKGGKQGNYDRVIKWIWVYRARKPKLMTYYNKLVFAKMTNGQITRLVQVLFDGVGDAKMARNAFGKLNLAKMPDNDKVQFGRYLWHKDFGLATELYMSMKDKNRGKHEMLTYHHWKRDAKKGIPLADHLIGVPEYASSALWKKGELLEWTRKFPEAILVFRQIPTPPDNLWRIADCYEKMGKVAKAISQLREVESFFKKHSAQAAIRIAHVYNRAKLKKQCIAAYRRVLVKYPDTNESSEAHHRLERMGITRIRGGVGDGKDDSGS